jgi:hypothetical protein
VRFVRIRFVFTALAWFWIAPERAHARFEMKEIGRDLDVVYAVDIVPK